MIGSGRHVSSLLESHGVLADPPTGRHELRFQLHNPGLMQFMTNAISPVTVPGPMMAAMMPTMPATMPGMMPGMMPGTMPGMMPGAVPAPKRGRPKKRGGSTAAQSEPSHGYAGPMRTARSRKSQ